MEYAIARFLHLPTATAYTAVDTTTHSLELIIHSP